MASERAAYGRGMRSVRGNRATNSGSNNLVERRSFRNNTRQNRAGRTPDSVNTSEKKDSSEKMAYRKFLEAKALMESSVKKHLQEQSEYESSEEEDELEDETILSEYELL